MAKKPAVRTRNKSSLSLALDHVALCCNGPAHYAPYCMFTPGWLVGFDGIVGAGFRVAEDMPGVCPHTDTFRAAVARAGDPFSITVGNNATLTVRGENMRAVINLFPPDAMHNVMPAHPLCEVTEAWRTAMVEAARVTSNRNDRVIGASVMLKNASVVGTDGGTILEAYHGCNLPGQWLLPREFVEAISKVKYLPTHVGWDDSTFTVWFGPNAFVRSNVYGEKYPDTDIILAKLASDGAEYRPVPESLLLALETLKPFLMPGKFVVLTDAGVVCCDEKLTTPGASYALQHYMPTMRVLPYEGLRFAAMNGKYIAFNKDAFFWYGDVVRGATACSSTS